MRKENGTLEAEDQFEEWFQATDLGGLPGADEGVFLDASERSGRPRIGKKISLTLPEELIKKLKKEAQKRGDGLSNLCAHALDGKNDRTELQAAKINSDKRRCFKRKRFSKENLFR
jgi:hypothetical protein